MNQKTAGDIPRSIVGNRFIWQLANGFFWNYITNKHGDMVPAIMGTSMNIVIYSGIVWYTMGQHLKWYHSPGSGTGKNGGLGQH